MKTFKKIVSIFLALCVIILPMSVCSSGADITELTFLYIDKGSIVIGDDSVLGYGAYGEEITEPNSAGYCITMAGSAKTSNTVEISGGENYILLKDVNIQCGDFNGGFSIYNGAAVDMFFTGSNTIISDYRGGIEIYEDSSLTLAGDGILNVQSSSQAGIGGSGGSNGTLTINSGTIIAKSSYESAGIGGGSSGEGGSITINGGNVYARGGSNAAGIGGGNGCTGGNITINGGTVTAAGGTNAAGIGGGWYGRMGSVVINGGAIKATGGSGASGIGAGKGIAAAQYPVNDGGERVYPVTINSAGSGAVDKLYINGKDYNVCGAHIDDSRLYVYLPAGSAAAAVKPADSDPMLFGISGIGSSGASVTRLSNPQGINGAEIGSDDVIRGISCGRSSIDDYIDLKGVYTLSYDSTPIGTGTAVTLMYNGIPVYNYRALLYGDLNNDGWYDGEDSFIVLLMLWRMLTSENTDALIFEAADVNADGGITQEDMEILQQAGLLLAEIMRSGQVDTDSAEFMEYQSIVDQRSDFSADEAEEPLQPEQPEQAASFFGFVKNLVIFIENVIKLLLQVGSFWNI